MRALRHVSIILLRIFLLKHRPCTFADLCNATTMQHQLTVPCINTQDGQALAMAIDQVVNEECRDNETSIQSPSFANTKMEKN